MTVRNRARRVAIYARVSTDAQTTDNQIRELRAAADRHDWQVVAEFVDRGISGAKGRKDRPALDNLLRGAVRTEFDLVAAWSVDRLGRSLQDLLSILSELHAKHIDLYLHQQGVDTTTPAGRALFSMCGVFAEFERSMIQERVKAGLARAKDAGKTLGRPQVSAEVEAQVRALHANGVGKVRLAKQLGIGVSAVQRIVRSSED